MYDDLLTALLGSPDRTLVIQGTEVTPSAIRQGLRSALTRANQMREICDIPAIKGSITVSSPCKSGNITIRVSTELPQATVKYTIVTKEEDSNG